MPSSPCDVKVFKKGKENCWSGDLVVNGMLGSKKFRWVRNYCLCPALWMTNVSLTNLVRFLVGWVMSLKLWFQSPP